MYPHPFYVLLHIRLPLLPPPLISRSSNIPLSLLRRSTPQEFPSTLFMQANKHPTPIITQMQMYPHSFRKCNKKTSCTRPSSPGPIPMLAPSPKSNTKRQQMPVCKQQIVCLPCIMDAIPMPMPTQSLVSFISCV